MINRIPTQLDISDDELRTLREIVARSFTPAGHIQATEKAHLLALGLVLAGMGGLMPTPAGRMVARL